MPCAACISRLARIWKRSTIGFNLGRVLGDRAFADQARDQMGLDLQFQRIAKIDELVVDQLPDQRAGALDRLLAFHHRIEIEIVDQGDQDLGQAFMGAKHVLQTGGLVIGWRPPS